MCRGLNKPYFDVNMIDTYHKLFFPMYNADIQHWSLVVVHIRKRQMFHLDSLGRPGESYINKVKKFMVDLYDDLGLKNNTWMTFATTADLTPKQSNGNDCGVFLLLFAYCISFNIPLTRVKSTETEHYRDVIARNFIQGKNLEL